MLKDPEPAVYVDQLGDSAVVLQLRAWTNGPDWVQTRFSLIEQGKVALDAAGISIPFPQTDLHVKDLPSGFEPEPGPRDADEGKQKNRKSAA